MLWLNVSYFPQWPKSSVCPRLTRLCPVPSRHLRHPAPSTSCLCCCASDSAAVTCHFSRRCQPNDRQWQPKKTNYLQTVPWLCSVSVSAQTLDSSELEGDGIVLSLEEQLNALSLTSSPSASGPDPKATVALNGTRFPSHLFEDTSKSTKVSNCYVYCPKISVKLLVLGWILPVKTVNFHDFSGFHRG